jgi:hypothetical protein
MCKNNLVHVMEGYEIQKPINGFDAKSIDTLLKGNTGRKPRLQLLASAPNIAIKHSCEEKKQEWKEEEIWQEG